MSGRLLLRPIVFSFLCLSALPVLGSEPTRVDNTCFFWRRPDYSAQLAEIRAEQRVQTELLRRIAAGMNALPSPPVGTMPTDPRLYPSTPNMPSRPQDYPAIPNIPSRPQDYEPRGNLPVTPLPTPVEGANGRTFYRPVIQPAIYRGRR